MTLEQLFSGQPVSIPAIRERLKKTAAELGLPFNGSDRLYNTRRAQELGLWAESCRAGEAFHSAVFRAYFVEDKNIAEIPILAELAESAGLSGEKAEEVLVTGSFKAAVDEDWVVSRALLVTAVPTFMMHGGRLVGAQSYEALENLIKSDGDGNKNN